MPAPGQRVAQGDAAITRGDPFVPAPDRTTGPRDMLTPSAHVLPRIIWLDEGDEDSDGLDAFVPESERRLFSTLPATPAGDVRDAPWGSVPPSPPAMNPASAGASVPARAPLGWGRHAMWAAVLCVGVAAAEWVLPVGPRDSPMAEHDVPPLPTVVTTAAEPRLPLALTPAVSIDVAPPAAVAVAAQPAVVAPVASPLTATPQRIATVAPAASPAAIRLAEVPRVTALSPPVSEPAPMASMPAPTPPPARAPDPAPPSAPVAAELARPAAVAVPHIVAVASPPPAEVDARAIDNVLDRYRDAFNTLDARAAVTVWPTVNEKALARAFDSLEGQHVSFDDCRIEITDVRADVACRGTARYVRKVGNRGGRVEPRQWTFSLRKEPGGWLIHRVDSR